MNFRGIYKTSLIDYPGKICTVLFVGGCNLQCRYCQNPDLACRSAELPKVSDSWLLEQFLPKRKSLIDGITITGGEPTIDPGLLDFCRKVSEMGLPVKLDTNGYMPHVVDALLKENLIDYVALDIKTSPEKYNDLTQSALSFMPVSETLNILKESGVTYELRTTCIPEYITREDIESIGKAVGRVGNYYLQQFVRDNEMIDPSLREMQPYPVAVLEEFQEIVSGFADTVELRGV